MRNTTYPGQVITHDEFDAIITFPTVAMAVKFEGYVRKGRYGYATLDGRKVLYSTDNKAFFDNAMALAGRKGWVVS